LQSVEPNAYWPPSHRLNAMAAAAAMTGLECYGRP
jgi:hypothetical protein